MTVYRTLLQKLGQYKTRKQGQEFIFSCPKCKRLKFEVNFKKRLFNCFRCGWSGGIYQLYGYFKLSSSKFQPILTKSNPIETKEITIPKYMDTSHFSWKERKYLFDRGLDFQRTYDLKWGLSSDPKYRNRVMIPIIEDGKIVCYTARAVLPAMNPKELFPKAEVANKSHFLYNYDGISARDEVIVVEGIFDCEHLVKLGHKSVAILGSKISETQIGKLLGKKPLSVTLMFDGDSAGIKGQIEAYASISKRYSGHVYMCKLPFERDPDELTKDEIETLLRG